MEPVTGKLEAVAAATKVFLKADAAAKQARAQLHATILDAIEAGERQVDVTDRSPYKREQIRRIVEADKRKRGAES